MRFSAVISLVVLLGLSSNGLSQCSAQPQQLLTNCAFDSTTTGWSFPAGFGMFSHNNSVGNNAVGSLECASEIDGTIHWCQAQQCIAVSASTMYGAGFDVMLLVDLTGGYGYMANSQARVTSYSDMCSTIIGASSQAGATVFPTTAGWVQTSGDITTEVGATHARFEMNIFVNGGVAGDEISGVFDDAFFGLGMTPVELQTFQVD